MSSTRPAYGTRFPRRRTFFGPQERWPMSSAGQGARAPRPRVRTFVETITLQKAVAAVIGTALAVSVSGSILLKVLNPGAFKTYGDAAWLAVITVTTVGYGDVVPTNTAGRWVAALIALLGISLVPALTSLVTSILVVQRTRRLSEEEDVEQRQIIELLRRLDERLERIEQAKS